MKFQPFISFSTALLCLSLISSGVSKKEWKRIQLETYSIQYKEADEEFLNEYQSFFDKGKTSVEAFFGTPFKGDYTIYIHPTRESLDSTWQKDWGFPGFNSQCWMVASGVADRLDVISPKRWDSLSCEHVYTESTKTQNLITHELVHVYHGQLNKSPDFSEVNGLDWFIEGLAVYASGQCDAERIKEVKLALDKNEIPEELNRFWSGPLKYGLSGTVVMYLDQEYGRDRLNSLLQFSDIQDLTRMLAISEAELIEGWKNFMKTQ